MSYAQRQPQPFSDEEIVEMAQQARDVGFRTISDILPYLRTSLDEDYRYLKRRQRYGRRSHVDPRLARIASIKALLVDYLSQLPPETPL